MSKQVTETLASLHGRLYVSSFTEVWPFISRFEITHLLSLANCREGAEDPAPGFTGPHGWAWFADVRTEDSKHANIPSRLEVEKALWFGRSALQEAGSRLLVHCSAGMSRSPAIAIALATDFAGPGSEEAAVEFVMTRRPIAVPNQLVVRLADDILSRGGRLSKALETVEANLDKEAGLIAVDGNE